MVTFSTIVSEIVDSTFCRFFQVGNSSLTFASGFGIVRPLYSEYLCAMSLVTWGQHDLSYPMVCAGELRLGFGLGDVEGCESAVVRVSAVV